MSYDGPIIDPSLPLSTRKEIRREWYRRRREELAEDARRRGLLSDRAVGRARETSAQRMAEDLERAWTPVEEDSRSDTVYHVDMTRFSRLHPDKQRWYANKTDNMTRQFPPRVVILEPVEGCQWRCPSCAISAIRPAADAGGSIPDARFMPPQIAAGVARELRALEWRDTRIMLSGHGEPTMHPDLPGLVRVVRDEHPSASISMLTSGMHLRDKPGPFARLMTLYESGVSYIGITLHDLKMLDVVMEVSNLLARNGVRIYRYPENPAGRPDQRVRKDVRILSFLDAPRYDGPVDTLRRNMAGSAGPLTAEMHRQSCSRPFQEMMIRWNGQVSLCQDDWRGQYRCGSVLTLGVAGVWDSPQMNAARQYLARERRMLSLCRGCNSRVDKAGSLPDATLVMRMRKPSSDASMIVQAAQAGDPYTQGARRPWEI